MRQSSEAGRGRRALRTGLRRRGRRRGVGGPRRPRRRRRPRPGRVPPRADRGDPGRRAPRRDPAIAGAARRRGDGGPARGPHRRQGAGRRGRRQPRPPVRPGVRHRTARLRCRRGGRLARRPGRPRDRRGPAARRPRRRRPRRCHALDRRDGARAAFPEPPGAHRAHRGLGSPRSDRGGSRARAADRVDERVGLRRRRGLQDCRLCRGSPLLRSRARRAGPVHRPRVRPRIRSAAGQGRPRRVRRELRPGRRAGQLVLARGRCDPARRTRMRCGRPASRPGRAPSSRPPSAASAGSPTRPCSPGSGCRTRRPTTACSRATGSP